MNIDESQIEYDGWFNEEAALACLLAAGVCFLNNINISPTSTPIYTTCVYVNCNDVFAWGCADAEPIVFNDGDPNSEIESLYKLWKENSSYGSVKWVCIKRNEQPQPPLKKYMIDAGYWDDLLESLPGNHYAKMCRENNPVKPH